MPAYNGVDYIDFDSLLNDEEKLARQSARQFVEAEVIPIIEKHSREGTFPKHLVPQLGELGFFGASLHGYGCAGMSNVAYGLVTQELERRLRSPQFRLGAKRARHVSDLCLRQRRAK